MTGSITLAIGSQYQCKTQMRVVIDFREFVLRCRRTVQQSQVREPTSSAFRQHLPDRALTARVQIDVHHPEIGLGSLKTRKAPLAAKKMVFDKNQLDAFWNLCQKVIFEMIVSQVLH